MKEINKRRRVLSLLAVIVMIVSLALVGTIVASADDTTVISESITWNDGDVINGAIIEGGTADAPIVITVKGTVTVSGTIKLSPSTISNVIFKGENGAKLIRATDFTGQMFYAEGVSGNFQNLAFKNITLDGGAVWTGDVNATLGRGTENSGVKATGSVLYLVYANATLDESTLQNHHDSTGEKANAVFLRYYSTITFNSSVVRNNRSESGYYRGGVITVRQGGTATTNKTEVYGNSSPNGGFFGISSTGSYGGIAEAYDSKFHNNYADNGAVFLMQCQSKKGYLLLDGCEFYGNGSKTAVLTEWAYSRPFTIKDTYFHDNECAIWDCHADPVLDLSGKIVIKGDPDYEGYLFETPIVLGGPLAEGSSIEISEASLTKLSKAGYFITGNSNYTVTAEDLGKLALPEGKKAVIADVNGDGIGDIVPLQVNENEEAQTATLTLKDSLDSTAVSKSEVYSAINCLPANPFKHNGLVFAGWVDENGNKVAKQNFTASATLTATWAVETPVVSLSREVATLKANITNKCDDFTYTYQWYKDGVAIEGATASTYTMTDINSAKYKCVVTASADGVASASGSIEGTSSAPAMAQIGETKYKTLKEAIEAANAIADGATIQLLEDVTLGEKLTISGNVTISGAKTITRADNYTGTLFVVKAGATLTLDGGLTIDGGNNWTFNSELYNKDLEAKLAIPKSEAEKYFAPEAGAPVATAFMITTTGGTINLNSVTIQNNYSINSGVVLASANSTITLNGAKITHVASTQASGVAVNADGAGIKVTMNEGTVIDGNHVGGNHGIFKIYSGAVLTMNGGEVKNTTGWNSNGNVVGLYGGTFIMNGGTICSNSALYGPNNGRNAAIYLHANSVMEMNGGTICHNTGLSRGGIDSSKSSSKLTITGGEVLDNISLAGYPTADIGGTVGTWIITGGTFAQDVSAWLAPDCGLVYNEATGTYGIADHVYELYFYDPVTGEQLDYVGPLQGSDPSSLVALGKLFYADYYVMELKVLSNVKVDEPIVIDYPMTVNLNGHTITAVNNVYPVIRVQGGADVTVTGNGTIKNATDYVFVLGASDGSSEGNLIIENGKFIGNTTVASVTKGTLTINGGHFECTDGEFDATYLLNCVDANYKNGTAKIVVKGGEFVGFNPADNAAEGTGTSFVDKDFVSVDNGNGTVTVISYVEWVKAELLAGNDVTLDRDIIINDYSLVNALKLPSNGNGKYGVEAGNGAIFHIIKPGVVLDLNGHSIIWDAHDDAYCNKRQVSLFLVTATGNPGETADLTVIDSVGTGKVEVYGMASGIYVTIKQAKATIEGGTWTNYLCKTCGAQNIFMYPSHGGTLAIAGGTFEQVGGEHLIGAFGSTKETTENNVGVDYDSTKVEISGGNFVGMNPGEIKFFDIAAGGAQSTANGCANGFAPMDNGDGTYGITTAIKISGYSKTTGEKFWMEFNQDHFGLAFKEMMDHDNYNWVLTISNDVVVTEPIVINKDIIIDLNGYTITGENVYPVIRVQGGANVTVKNGTIKNATDYVFVLGASDGSSAGNLIIENGTFIGSTTVASVTKGTLTINGGHFECTDGEFDATYLLNCVDANYKNGTAKIVVKGGEFKGFNPANNAAEGTGTSFVAEGFAPVDMGNNTYGVIAAVAEINGVGYATLQEALAACKNGETVKLLTDITYTGADVTNAIGGATGFGQYPNPCIIGIGGQAGVNGAANIPSSVNAVIDLNGHTLKNTADAYFFMIMDNAKVAFTDSVGGGAVITTADAPAVWVIGTETLVTIKGGYFETASAGGVLHSTHGGDLVIEGGEFDTTATDKSLLVMLNSKDRKNSKFFISGVATVTIKGGTFHGFNPTKIGDDNGATSIEDIKFVNGCAPDFVPVENNDGTFGVKYNVIEVSTKAELNQALVDATEGMVIRFTANIDYGTDQLKLKKAITLDLGGHTLTTRNAWGGMSVENNATVKNGTIVHASNTAAIKVWNATAFENLVIDVQGKGDANKIIGGIVLQSGSTTRVGSIKNVTIKGAALTNGIETYNCGDATENVIGSMENVTIDSRGVGLNISAPVGTATNCTIKGDVNGIEIWIKGNYSATLNLANCEVEGGVYAHDEFSSNPEIVNNGTLSLTVSGTTLDDITLTLARAENVAGVLKDIKDNAQAKVNNTYYATLAEALAAATAGQTITFIADITEDVTVNKAVIIDGANFKYTGTMTLGAYTIEIKNINFVNGEIVQGTTSTGKYTVSGCTFVGKCKEPYAITVGGGATTIEIKDCTSTGVDFFYSKSGMVSASLTNVTINSPESWAIHIYPSIAATFDKVIINDAFCGIVTQNWGANRNLTLINCQIDATKPIVVWEKETYSVTFNFIGTNSFGSSAPVWAIANKAYVQTPGAQYAVFKFAQGATLECAELEGLRTTTDVEGYVVAYDNGAYSVVEDKKPVAMIGETPYYTLTEALAAATAGQTITFVADITEDVTVNKAVTIDGANFKYTGTMTLGAYTIEIKNINFVNGEIVKTTKPISGDFTITDCTFTGATASGYAIKIGYASKLNIARCKSYDNSFLYVQASLTALEVSDVTIDNAGWAFHLVSIDAPKFTNITITRSTNGIVVQNTGKKSITLVGCDIQATRPIVIWEKQTNDVTFTLKEENDFGTIAPVWGLTNAQGFFNDPGSEYAVFKFAQDATLKCAELEGLRTTTDVEGYVVAYDNGAYSVVEDKKPVAMIGETPYYTLQDAIDACVNAGEYTIKLIADITENVTVKQTADVNITIDGANFKYTGTLNIGTVTDITIQNVNFVKGSIDGNTSQKQRELIITNCTFDGVDKSIGYAITVRHGVKVDITNCSATNYSIGMLYVPQSVTTITVKDVTVSNVAAAFNISYSGNSTFENVVIEDTVTYGLHVQNRGARTFSLKACEFNCKYPIYVQVKSTYTVTFAIEGTDNVFVTDTKYVSQYANIVLKKDAILTAPNLFDIGRADDVSPYYRAVYANGVYSLTDKVILKDMQLLLESKDNDLGNTIGIIINMEVTEGAKYVMVVTKTNLDGTKTIITVPVQESRAIITGVDAKMMTDKYTIYVTAEDSETSLSDTQTVSIRGYAEKGIREGYITGNALNLVVAMLNYGAAAQKEFNYKANDLANNIDILDDEQKVVTFTPVANPEVTGKTDNFAGSSLMLQSELIFAFKFYAEGIDPSKITAITVNGTTYEGDAMKKVLFYDPYFKNANGEIAPVIVVKFNAGSISEANSSITCTISGTEGTIASATDSIINYCSRAVNALGAESDAAQIYKALAQYAIVSYNYEPPVEQPEENN